MQDDGFVDVSFMMHCVVYALLRRDEVVYVGQSKKPLARLATHSNATHKLEPYRAGIKQRKAGFKFDGIWIRPCMLSELDEVEAAMIRKYQPRHNVKHMPEKPCLELQMLIEMMPAVCMTNELPQPRQTAPWRRL